jgi:hypothetical protein
VKNRGAAVDDAATSILAGSQRAAISYCGRRMVASWRGDGILPHHCRTSAGVRGVPGRSDRHDFN